MLILKEIKKDYVTSSETVQALKGVSIAFRDREFVSILGPSGCGKTTLLNIVGGLDRYTSGDLVINGRSTKKFTDRDWDVYRNHRVGFIFQSYNLIPHQTVLGNVELALTIAGIDKEERIARAKAALDKVGLANQYYKKPNQLSGGQCQRVAIARALVNDPEILLADEPTGALDTVTSVQIMDLIKEIAKERLVIMVTHNPELAEEYSTRIIKLLDGNVQEDSNAPTEEEVAAAEALELAAIEKEREEEKLLSKKEKREKKRKKEKAKMSPITAFMLSAKNLLSKKGRTSLVGVAGSIGIIGIALVLAFSAGIRGYIASMQDDMLSGNPITITESTLDLSALTGMVNNALDKNVQKLPGNVYVSSLVEYIIKSGDAVITNDISEEYIKYVQAMPRDYYNAIKYDYGISMVPNIFVDFKASANSDVEHVSIKLITDMYKELLNETSQSGMSMFVDMLAPSLQQAPNSPEYILSQYDLLGGGKLATEKGEVMLVLNSEDEISDLLLARLGYFTEAEFIEIINKANSEVEHEENGTEINYNDDLYRDYFSYDELLNKTLTWYPTDTVFTAQTTTTTPAYPPNAEPVTKVEAIFNSSFAEKQESGLELKVVGILTPKDNITFGALTSGIYYTEALTEYMLEVNGESEFIDTYVTPDLDSSAYKSISYKFSYYAADAFDENGNIAEGAVKTESKSTSVFMSNAKSLLRSLGGNDIPNGVSIFPISFEDKYKVTEYLDKWNEDLEEGEVFKYIDSEGNEVIVSEKTDVSYTDAIELMVNLINTMIDIVSYALIAFTSVSLVVSTVMIGIITYVSVVERIKEIGVIRSLGGRKRDVSRLFTAETFIIGLLAGVIGIAFTYIVSAIVNAILKPLIGYATICALPFDNALLLIGLSVALTLLSGVAPARSAARKDPVVALRTE